MFLFNELKKFRCRSSGDAPPTSPVINSHSVQITTSPTVDLVLTIREPLSANRLRPLSSTVFSFDDPKKDSVSFPQQSKILSSGIYCNFLILIFQFFFVAWYNLLIIYYSIA